MDPARLTEEQATARRASLLGFKYVDTSTMQKQLFKDIMPTKDMYAYRLIPLAADEHHIDFGITTTTSQQTINRIRSMFTDQRVSFSIISETGYNDFMRLYDPPKQVEYQDISITGTTGDEVDKMIGEVSATLDKVRPDDMLAYLVQQAYRLKASDIHIENQKDDIRVRFRVDGVLHPVANISREKYRHLSSSLASAANVSTSAPEAQTGHISSTYKLATGESVTLNLRVETVPAFYGMDAVMRLFNMNLDFFKLDKLGLDPKELEQINQVIKHPVGMVLIVGPTGSGKTTSLYSIINTLNTSERKIITLEDPVEYNLPGVVQIPVEGGIESHNFADKLRAVLRLDPDVVMVGEIRDTDTAKTALQGALTGHLVLSTFHADSAAAALTRMLDMVGINPLFASAMKLIMAQRLVRRLDDATKQAYKPDEALINQLQEALRDLPAAIPKPDLSNLTLYKPGSSAQNPFGYSGQLALREQLVFNDTLRETLRLPAAQITTELLQQKAVASGMTTMLHDGILKAISGITTIEEIYRVVG
jgi:type II secretory ATPase GspE/PulE/Tfp pilus assembly ATPase PilB-like protein